MKTRILALSLGLLLLLSSVIMLVSCANPDTGEKDNQGESQNPIEHLENLNFDGTEVHFIVASADGDDYHGRSIYVEEDDGDQVNEQIYTRNAKIERDLGVYIDLVDDQDRNITDQIKNVLLGGTDAYDVIGARQYDDIQLALEGVVIDINTLGEAWNADYIKWENNYWGTDYIKALSFGNKVYWLAGDICLRYIGGYYAIFVNSDLYRDTLYNEYGDIYTIVKNGDWDYDTFISMIPKGYQDDGNEKVDNVSDTLGLALPIWDNTNGMSISAGVIYTGFSADGTPYCTINNKNKTLLAFMEKFHELYKTKGVYNYNGDYHGAMDYFASDGAVFVAGRLNQAELYLSEMDTDYFVVPCPKLTKEQTDYYTGVHDAINIYGISLSSPNVAAAAATLEEMAYLSYENVRPVYFESVLKYKYTRDSEAVQMIQLMHDTVYTDFVFIWQFSDRFGSGSNIKLGDFLRQAVKNSSFSSMIKKNQDRWKTAVETILEEIEAMD